MFLEKGHLFERWMFLRGVSENRETLKRKERFFFFLSKTLIAMLSCDIFLCRAFSTLCYSPDGEFIIAAGQSKFICIYNVDEAILIKKFEVTQNRSLDGVDVSFQLSFYFK